MNKTLNISAIVTIVCLLVMRAAPYFEGLAFDKFWAIPMGVVPIMLVAFFAFFVSAIVTVTAVLRKKAGFRKLVTIGLFPVLVSAIYMTPFPSYIDGMHKSVRENLPMDEIVSLADEARRINPSWLDREEHDRVIKRLRNKYPNALNLASIPPRIEVTDKYVSVFYGSSLVKHWGYLVTDSEVFPIEHIPQGMYKKVYQGVWVYHDIW